MKNSVSQIKGPVETLSNRVGHMENSTGLEDKAEEWGRSVKVKCIF